jgi:hypothetical protein
MKKLLIGGATMLVCVGVFAQGKLAFDINTDNLIYFTTDVSKMNPGDATKTAVNAGGTPYVLPGSGLYTGAGGSIAALGGPNIIASLWAGTSSSALSLQTTTTIGDLGAEGGIASVNMTLPYPTTAPIWCQVQVYDSRATSAANAWDNQGWYAGVSQIFSVVPQASVYSPMWVTGSPVNSTWAPGTFQVADMVQYGPGYLGGIAVFATQGVIPEPGTFALAGLGLAALLVLRRRS